MPRASNGTYTLPVPPFVAGTTIRSADVNSDFSDIGLALTQSLATTGVSSMTGPIKGASGSVTSPSYTFVSAPHTGFFLYAADEIGWTTNSNLGAIFNTDLSVTWLGGATWIGDIGTIGNLAIIGSAIITGSLSVDSNLNVGIDLHVAGSVSAGNAKFTNYFDLYKQNATPTSPAANALRFYVKLDGLANGERPFAVDENGLDFPLMFTGGQCQLIKSGADLLLIPYQGNRLSINGVPQVIPDTGVILAASNTAATFVYIYAYMSAGVMVLEKSTTVPILQAGTGIKQKTGDASRTLVGAAYTDVGGAWADTDGKLWVLSYFNRKSKSSKTTITVSVSTTSTTYIEIDSGMRNNFINWGDENVIINSKTACNPPGGTISAMVQGNIDATTSLDSMIGVALGLGAAAGVMIPNYSTITGLTENTTHFATTYIRSPTAAAIVVSLGVSAKEATAVYVEVNG